MVHTPQAYRGPPCRTPSPPRPDDALRAPGSTPSRSSCGPAAAPSRSCRPAERPSASPARTTSCSSRRCCAEALRCGPATAVRDPVARAPPAAARRGQVVRVGDLEVVPGCRATVCTRRSLNASTLRAVSVPRKPACVRRGVGGEQILGPERLRRLHAGQPRARRRRAEARRGCPSGPTGSTPVGRERGHGATDGPLPSSRPTGTAPDRRAGAHRRGRRPRPPRPPRPRARGGPARRPRTRAGSHRRRPAVRRARGPPDAASPRRARTSSGRTTSTKLRDLGHLRRPPQRPARRPGGRRAGGTPC